MQDITNRTILLSKSSDVTMTVSFVSALEGHPFLCGSVTQNPECNHEPSLSSGAGPLSESLSLHSTTLHNTARHCTTLHST